MCPSYYPTIVQLYCLGWASLLAQTVKNLPAMRETQVRSLGGEDLPEKRMATHSSILAWRIPWTEEPVDYSPWDCKKLDTTERLFHCFSLYVLFTWGGMTSVLAKTAVIGTERRRVKMRDI